LHKNKKKIAQSASELAIFGAILMFVIGLVVKVGLNQGLALNVQLRAMRMALTESYKTACGSYRLRGGPSGGRNSASVFILMDHLSTDAAKALGTGDRIPMMASGSGTYTHNLFWKVEWGDDYDLPVYDVFINNQRFPFTILGYREISFKDLNAGVGPPNWEATIDNYKWEPLSYRKTFSIPDCTIDPAAPICWEPNCNGTSEPGCLYFFAKQQNVVNWLQRISNRTPAGEGWCDEVISAGPNGREACPGGAAEADARFDLDHDGTTDIPAGTMLNDGVTPLRDFFAWQWVRVAGLQRGTPPATAILNPKSVKGIAVADGVNSTFDVDGDGKEENLYSIKHDHGWIKSAKYSDGQSGDIDFEDEDMGLQKDMQIFSQAKAPQFISGSLYGGSYVLIEEGKLYGSGGQFIRDVTRQDRIDMVVRFFQISNHTGRFCNFDNPPLPRVWNSAADTDSPAVQGVRGLENPVKACGQTIAPATISTCISDPTKVNVTCFDVDTHMMYVRTQIEDLRGHSWLTRVFQ